MKVAKGKSNRFARFELISKASLIQILFHTNKKLYLQGIFSVEGSNTMKNAAILVQSKIV